MSGISSLEIFVFIIFVFNACVSVTQAGLVYCVCGTAGNYTNNSIYENNLNSAVTYLSAAANTSNYGFYNASVGENSDTVNTLVLCRSDVQPDICRSCIRDSINKSRELCPNQKEALVWYDECMFRYSNRSIFNNVDTQPIIFVSNVNNASNPDEFSKDLGDLFDNLKGRAIQEKFAAGIISGPDSVTIYGLMQCTPDLSSTQCSACLDEVMGALPSCCSGNIGGQILSPSCKLRFEESRFFNGTLYDASRPPPPPSPPPKLPPPLPVSPPPSPVSPPGKDDNTAQTVIIVVVVVVTLAILLLILVCIFKRKQKQRTTATEESKNDMVEDINSVESLQYNFATIEVATDYFSDSNKLGQGGFGAVYKGTLHNGKEVAVKRLSRGSAQGELEFKNEVMLVARLQHRNLVRLLGFCYEGTERLLIYEFVPNASLDQFIFDSVKRSYLDWERRYKILGGIAKGILYLHEDSRLRIIHRDLKASNVLLDAEMNPKIADFGMAKLFDFDETQGNTNRIVGTYGYMAPEYALYGLFSVKSDVFSFGMLVLEIVSGRKNHSFQNEDNTEDLASFAWKNWREGTASSVIDPLLRDSSGSVREMIRCIHIGLLCVQENVTDRPTMASVMLMLNSFSINLAVPSVPGFFVPSRIDPAATLHGDNNKSKLSGTSIKANEKSVDFSINEASITDLYPR